jgi:hypothetical protein
MPLLKQKSGKRVATSHQIRIEIGAICKFSANRAKTDGKKWRAFANSDDSQGRMIFA